MRFIFFGGKGGVGKTTSACATAAYLARSRPYQKILVFSTDPAHSTSDSFAQTIGDEPTPVEGFDNLCAMEMNLRKVYESFVREYEFEFIELAERSSYFGIKQMSNATATLTYPSSFEFMTILKFIEFINSTEYDLIVVDTAPTGHTLRLFELFANLPDQFKALERSQRKHRYMLRRYYGKYRKDRVDKFLDVMKKDVERLGYIFSSNRTEFVAVTIAEKMAIWETTRLIKGLRKTNYQIPNRNIVVNGLSTLGECSLCSSRRKEEERYLVKIKEEFPQHNIIRIPLFPYEIKGKRLSEYFEYIKGEKRFEAAQISVSQPELPDKTKPNLELIHSNTLTPLENERRKVILFGGKGGVGKTTSAASTAVHIARANPDQRVLVVSTDPAHSLADSFDLPIGGNISLIEGFDNLYGLQIDPQERLEKFKKEYKRKIEEAFTPEVQRGEGMFSGSDSATSYPFDEDMVSNLVELAPLGLDEIMTLSGVLLRNFSTYEVIIIDTAPTGHLVKLLQRPKILLRWFTQLVQGLKNYSGMMRDTFEVTKELLEARREIMRIHKIFMDENETEFVVVTIAEFMGIYETKRLIQDLESLKMLSRFIIVNKIVPENNCPFCQSKRSEELSYIDQIGQKFSSFQLVEAPLFPYEIKGVKRLVDFANCLYEKRIEPALLPEKDQPLSETLPEVATRFNRG
ncbi:MAG: ArsA family ATPase [bacterium]